MTLRTRLCLIPIALFAFGTTAFAAKPLSPNTSFETTDGTLPPLQGEVVSGTGDGPGWAGPWVSSYLPEDILYDNSQSTTGQWSMLLDTTGRSEEPLISRVFAKPIKKGLVMFRAQINRTDRNGLNIFISNGDPEIRTAGEASTHQALYIGTYPEKYFNLTSGFADIGGYDGSSNMLIADNIFSANVWHEVLIEFNCSKDGGIYDVYIDGDKLNVTPLHFHSPQIALDRIDIYTGAGQNQDGSSNPEPGSKHWIEDVVVWRK